ncbi:MAG TPA: hypothetical protein VK599_08760, partial [Streptosporangiaceae bacterium]|nr:hypothetical protein [Streptosporangiaceae bacterium]
MQIRTLEQCRIIQAPPHLVEQVPLLTSRSQLTEDVTDHVNALQVQQQPGATLGDGQHALG